MVWLKWIDIPPIWLAAHLAIAYWIPFGLPGLPILGYGLCAIGVALMVLAVLEMRRHRTTVIPHLQANALVTNGIFAFSRNPIYLGDLLVLLGASLAWGSLVGLVLIPDMIWILYSRFIVLEEARLRHKFPREFENYTKQTRRWL